MNSVKVALHSWGESCVMGGDFAKAHRIFNRAHKKKTLYHDFLTDIIYALEGDLMDSIVEFNCASGTEAVDLATKKLIENEECLGKARKNLRRFFYEGKV